MYVPASVLNRSASHPAPDAGASVWDTPHNDAGASVWVTPYHDAGSREGPQTGRGLYRVFLDTASRRGMTWSTASQRSMTKKVRNDRSHIRRKRAASTKQTPPLSGREETSRPRKKGEDCLSTASSAAPEGGDSLRAKKPDNSGGASWFVLLAVEKNEHTGSPRTRCGVQRGASCGYCLCRYSLPGYFWIPHQVRNDGKYRVTARYDVEHRIKCGMTEKKRNI